MKRALKTGVTVVGRLRKDAALRDLPTKLKKGQRRGRGRSRKYGKNRLSLAKRTGQQCGWKTIAWESAGYPRLSIALTAESRLGIQGN